MADLRFTDSEEELELRSSSSDEENENFFQSLDNEIPELDELSSSSSDEEELIYPDTYFLPILFTKDKNERERMWKVWISGNTVHRLSGLIDGKKVNWKRSFKGKNIGKKNGTTSEEQAKQEGEKMWIRQTDKNYKPKCKEGKAMYKRVMAEKAKLGGQNTNSAASLRGRKTKNITPVKNFVVPNVEKIIPMKANKWEMEETPSPLGGGGSGRTVKKKVLKYFDFDEGIYVQTKLDGWRCIGRSSSSGVVILTTNSGKQYPWFESLRKELLIFLQGKDYLDGLDGELYIHRIIDKDEQGDTFSLSDNKRFSTIQSMCSLALKQPHRLEYQICYYIFDLVDLSGKYDQDTRFAKLKKLFSTAPKEKTNHIIMTETHVANFQEEIYDYQNKCLSKCYEGVIIRSRKLQYKQKVRSLEMRKYKHFVDAEFTVVNIKLNEGVNKEYFVWVCETTNGKRFSADPCGTVEERIYYYENYLEYLGKSLTVKFQEYNESGVPRIGKAKCFREDGDI